MTTSNSHNKENINLNPYFIRILRNWYFYVIAFFIAILLGYAYYRYTTPTYIIRCSLNIKDKNTHYSESSVNLLQDINAFSSNKNINNEIFILKSNKLIAQTLNELKFDVAYFKNGTIKDVELFPDAPFIVKLDTSYQQFLEKPFSIEVIDDNNYYLSFKQENLKPSYINNPESLNESVQKIDYQSKHFFGEWIREKYFSFQIVKNDNYASNQSLKNKKFFFIIKNKKKELLAFQEKIKIEPVQKDASILELNLESQNIPKGIHFLNTLSKVYVKQGLEEKNEIANNIIKFIDLQVSLISDSINKDETQLEIYHSNEQIQGIDQSINQYSKQLEALEKEKGELLIKNKYYKFLLEYAQKNEDLNKLIAPSAIGIDDPLLHSLIQETNKINQEKTTLSYSVGENNPSLKILEMKLNNARKSIIENVNAILHSTQIALDQINNNIFKNKIQLEKIPNAEKKLSQIKRKYTHNDFVYNFLMEKRAAASIAQASNTPDNKILDEASLKFEKPIKPNLKYIIAMIVLFTFVAPSIIIGIKYTIKNTIETIDEISSMSSSNIFKINQRHDTTKRLKKYSLKTNTTKQNIDIKKISLYLEKTYEHYQCKKIGFQTISIKENANKNMLEIAINMAQFYKVLIIDANPYEQNTLKPLLEFVTPNQNLIDILYNPTKAEDSIARTQIENLDIITTGKPSEQYFQLLKYNFKNILNTFSHRYQYLFVYAPSIHHYAEYLTIMEEINIHLFQIDEGVTTESEISTINDFITQQRMESLGIIYQN